MLQKVAEQRLSTAPGNPALWFALGSIAFERGDLRTSEAALLHSIHLDPGNAEALNNLAWLYATAPKGEFRRPDEAVRFAERAVQLQPNSPHILDTLAEAYFISGFADKALEIEQKALALATERSGYYRAQVERFGKTLPEAPR